MGESAVSDQSVTSEILRRESRSFLQYVRESFPWASGKDAPIRVEVQRIADSEAAALGKFGRLMQKKHFALPALGAFPNSFTDSNFVAVSYLIPKLVDDQRPLLNELERDLVTIMDPDLRNAVEALRELKHRNLSELERLVASKAA
jgi:hypothetical protein